MSNPLCEKRLVFTVCTGRCGTELLAQRLAQLPGVDCQHEPAPSFVSIMRDVQSDPGLAKEFWTTLKLPAIANSPEPIYSETTHLFAKGFLEPLLDLGIVPDLILLSRSHREIAQSLLRLNCVPDRTEAGRSFLLSPDDPGVLPVVDWRSLNDYQLCYWYCLETERRQHAYAKLIRSHGGNAVSTTLQQIRTASGMMRLVESLNLPKPGIVRQLLWTATSARRVNRKRKHKRVLDSDTPINELERQVIERVQHADDPATRAA